MIWLIVACLGFGCYSSHPWLIGQCLAGPAAAGRWSGMQNAIGNCAGILAPWITGLIVNKTGQFLVAFAVVAGVLLVGACVLHFYRRTRRTHPLADTTSAYAGSRTVRFCMENRNCPCY